MSHEGLEQPRSKSPYSTKEKVGRVLWAGVEATLFRWSFHNWYSWRRGLLRAFGAKIHKDARIRRTVRIEIPWHLTIGAESSVGDRAILYCLGPVCIGRRVSISQGAHLCAGSHDYRTSSMSLLRLPITVGDDAWIAAEAFVGPSVEVGNGAILGARACAMKHLEAWTIYAGNPAEVVKRRPQLEARAVR